MAGRVCWELQTYTLCDGWINVSTDENGQPVQFETKSEADVELQALVHDMRDAVDAGDLEDFDEADWRVVAVECRA